MKTSYFFNQQQSLPSLPRLMDPSAFTDHSNGKNFPEYIRPLNESLESELDTRMEILNQTSMVTFTDIYGTIMYANDLFCSTSGFSRTEVIGHTHKIIRHPDLQDETV